MLRDVFRFSDKRANDLMTHRRDVIVLHPTDTQEEVLRVIHEEHFSKYLLVESGKDEIIGVVSVKRHYPDVREVNSRSICVQLHALHCLFPKVYMPRKF